MCGIAGIIYKDGRREIGHDMTRMLQSMKHRGPDSTGYALFGPHTPNLYVMRYKLADANDPPPTYYSAATGTGATLKSQLDTIIKTGYTAIP